MRATRTRSGGTALHEIEVATAEAGSSMDASSTASRGGFAALYIIECTVEAD